MNTTEMLNEIRDANLNYLMLARQMIRADRASAIFVLACPPSWPICWMACRVRRSSVSPKAT